MGANMKHLTIGALAKLTGVSADTLRYYEKMKLLGAPCRSAAGYRLYDREAAHVVRFIRGAKSLDFTLVEIRKLLDWDTSDRATCAQMVTFIEGKLVAAEARIRDLQELRRVLADLIAACPRDGTPLAACPIMDHIRKATTAVALLSVAALSLAAPRAEAKPISYVGGTMAMQENDETGHTLALDYTVDPRLALGIYAKQEENGKRYTVLGPQLNTLLGRWNLPDGQANVFNSTGAGVARFRGADNVAAWTGVLADYETRRVFTSYEARFTFAERVENAFWQRARLGVAPYLADYDEPSTWFMLQVDGHPTKNETWVVTPLVRFFYKTALVEGGYSSNHRVMANWILQF